MKRIIYTLYIEIPKDDIDIFDKNLLKEGDTPVNVRTKNQFKLHYGDLCAVKEMYANKIGADFKLYEYDTDFMIYHSKMKTKYPFLTMYNIINFYNSTRRNKA